MNLNDLLADIDGIGQDTFAPAPAPPGAEVVITVELGQTRMPLHELAGIKPGDHLALGNRSGAPLKIFANDRLVGRGEALVVNGALAVRLVELFTPGEKEPR